MKKGFKDQLGKKMADGAIKAIKKTGSGVKNMAKQTTDLISNEFARNKYKKFKEKFNLDDFHTNLRNLINSRFFQKKQESFPELTKNDIEKNWYKLLPDNCNDYYYDNKLIFNFIVEKINEFYFEYCQPSEIKDKVQYFEFKK